MSVEDSLPHKSRGQHFHSAFWSRVSAPLRRLTWVGTLTATIGAALIARAGTPVARLTGAGLVLAAVSWMALIHVRRARQKNDLSRILSQIVKPSDPDGAARSSRALRLVEQAENTPHCGSAVLARQFADEALGRISLEAIEKRAVRSARVLDGLVAVALVSAFVLAVRSGHDVVEGLDVAFAYRGRAPVNMLWLDVTQVSAQPPGYLRIAEHSIPFGSHVSEPVGTTISVCGVRFRSGVDLVLTDGRHSADFVETAEGEVVAHWTLLQSARLKIAARFGPTLIEQEDSIVIDSEPDDTPVVTLENEGQTVRMGRVPRVELKYSARDDHGLRQIDLVLRTADRDDRRTLMRLDGQQREQSGAYALSVDDPFFRGVHLPTLIRVEARDDNSLVSNNWGHSGWVRVEPVTAGEAEAERIALLQNMRAKFVTWLADRVSARPPKSEHELALDRDAALATLGQSLTEQHELWHWPTQVELLLTALRERLSQVAANEEQRQRVLEETTLALDAVIGELGQRDARSVSHMLASLADEVALGARQASSTEVQDRGERRLSDAVILLRKGGRHLARLGDLGADLASVTRATLLRIERARAARDHTHVQLAAEYLAARLRRPEPSAGNAPAGGVESTAGSGKGSSRTASSDAVQRIERLLMELMQLRQEHRSGLELLERTVNASKQDASKDGGESTSEEDLARLRRIAENLPYMGAEPDSALSSQVVAREQALGAADSIRRKHSSEALDKVRAARDAISEALLRSKRGDRVTGDDQKTLRALDEELIRQARSLEQSVGRERKEIGQRAASQLPEQIGIERQLAKRARALARRERRGDAVIPEGLRKDLEHAAGFMDLASDALEANDGTQALDQERRAQELLDHINSRRGNRGAEKDRESEHQTPPAGSSQGTVASTGDPEAAARFRSRVQKGLSTQTPAGELGQAIRRYAEGLLR